MILVRVTQVLLGLLPFILTVLDTTVLCIVAS